METILKTYNDKKRKIKIQILYQDDKLIKRVKKQGFPPEDTILEKPETTQLKNDAKESAKNIPGWVTWTSATAVNYIEKNVTDLPSAKIVLKAMAKLIVALRDRVFTEMVLENSKGED